MKARDILIYLAIKYSGDWSFIYQAIKNKEKVDLEDVEIVCEKYQNSVITIMDKDYPLKLKNIYHPPFVIFYKGDKSLLNMNIISLVGSRDVNEYGKSATKRIIKDFINQDVCICSGLAIGVDAIAHDEAIKNNIKTIAVLPNGIESCYPKENFKLYNLIKEKGLLISEYPEKVKVDKKYFASRNRIIAGLSDSLVVPHVKKKSGTMVSVHFALEFGKDVYCVPYSIDDNSFGNTLIKEGAYLITDGKDVLKKICKNSY